MHGVNTRLSGKKSVYVFIIGGMLVIAALIMMIFIGDEGLITGVFLLAFGFYFSSFPGSRQVFALKNALKSPKETYIAENGIIYEGLVTVPIFPDELNGVTFKKRRE